MRYLFALLMIFFSAAAYAGCDYEKDIYPDIKVNDDLTCEEKEASRIWLKWAMYPDHEKALHSEQWMSFISANSEAASNLMREFVNYTKFDGAGNYEKWGILTGLPVELRRLTIRKSYDAYANGELIPFSSFIDCWGVLLLETDGLPEIASRVESSLKYHSFNGELLMLGILHNYNIAPKVIPSKGRLLQLYSIDYAGEEDFYDPDPEAAGDAVDVFLSLLASEKKC